MRWINGLVVIILAGVGLLLLHGAVLATGGSLNQVQVDVNDPTVDFTNIITITVLPSNAPYTPALTSYWQASVQNYPGPNAFSFSLRAADAYNISLWDDLRRHNNSNGPGHLCEHHGGFGKFLLQLLYRSGCQTRGKFIRDRSKF